MTGASGPSGDTTAPGVTAVFVPGERADPDELDGAGFGGIDVVVLGGDEVDPGRVDADCVVDGTDDPAPAVGTDLPVVAYGGIDPAVAGRRGYAAHVRREDGPARLADAIRRVVARDRAGNDAGSTGGTGGPAATGSGGFEALVEAMADGVILTDWDGTLAYLNRAAETTLGVSRERLLGRHVSTLAERGLLAPADIEELQAAAAELREGGAMVTHQLQVTPPDDDPRTVELRLVPAPSGAGIDGALVTVRDVTRRRRTERALRASRERIADLHEAATAIVACRSEEELYERAVDAAEQVLAFEVCSVLIRDGDWLVPRAVSSGVPDGSARRFGPGEGLVGETFRTGESFVVGDVHDDETADPVDDEYRSVISVPVGDQGVFQAVSTEPDAFDENDLELAELLVAHVTETLTRVRVERRLRERERDLVAERDRLAALFENVPDPCVAFDFEGGKPIVRAVNEPFEEVFGFEAETVVGEDVDEYIVPEDYETEAERLNETLQAGERLRTTSKRRTAEGVRDFLLHVVPLKTGERTVQGYAIYSDITEQKERERKLRKQNERLDQFAAMVSHDLRNPLNVAKGALGLAAETGDPEDLDRVRAAHDRMDRMINELLALARRGDVVGETRSVELSVVAAGAWEGVDTGDATLDVEGDATLEADPGRLSELLENLFRNAVEHGSTGDRSDAAGGDGSGVTVRVGPLEPDPGDAGEGDHGGFYVADDGPGIPDEERDRVFESGYTTRHRGTGFGLSIVRQIADAHGWSVAVTESEDGGARFEFTVPDPDREQSSSPLPESR